MGNIEKRIGRLEEQIGTPEGMGVRDWHRSEKRAELIAEIQRLDKLHAGREPEPRRVELRQEIEEVIERRRSGGA